MEVHTSSVRVEGSGVGLFVGFADVGGAEGGGVGGRVGRRVGLSVLTTGTVGLLGFGVGGLV